MKIFYVKYGYNCNSSSCHDIVLVDKDIELPEEIMEEEDGKFGRDMFFLKSEEHKLRYFSALNDKKKIDHNSLICFPHDNYGRKNLQFLEHFKEFLKREDVVIIGGRDNYDYPVREIAVGKSYRFLAYLYTCSVARYDEKFNYWTVLQKPRGEKIRFSFDDNTEEPKFSTYPELVDLNIIDYCENNCLYCYRGCGTHGGVADIANIKNFIATFHDMGVFEVVIGGGDITLHPRVIDIIHEIKTRGMAATTTISYDNIKRPVFRDILEMVDAIAITVTDSKIKLPYDTDKIYLQIPLGIMDEVEFTKILDTIDKVDSRYKKVILLGYKRTSHNDWYDPNNYDWIGDIIKKRYNFNFYADHILQQQLGEKFIKRHTNSIGEGKFSCFVDAIDMTVRKSSYSGKKHNIFNVNKETFGDVYSQITKEE